MPKIRIRVDSNKSRLIGSAKVIHKMHDTLKLRAPGYFFSPAYRRRVWDGYTRYVSEAGMFATGNLDWICEELRKQKVKYIIEDTQTHFKDLHIVAEVGGKKMSGKYHYQFEAVRAVLSNELEGVKYIRGILAEATNAGKNVIAAAIMASFSTKRRGLFLIDNSPIYEQAIKELEELLPGQIGSIRGKKIKWGRLTVAMVQTLGPLAKKNYRIQNELAKIDILLIDECDSVIPKKQAQPIFVHCHNAPVRIGLSGTPLDHKEKTRNLVVKSYLGPIIHSITNKQLVDAGVSSKPTFKILTGNDDYESPQRGAGMYMDEYKYGIIRNQRRNAKVWRVIRKQKKKKRMPVLILFKNHAHVKYLLRHRPPDLENLTYAVVHHKTGDRRVIFREFMEGKIQVLLASMIIKRGMNIGIMKTLINAAGGDSQTNVKQILGRGLRKIAGVKEEIWVYDFFDKGKYLQRHSKHRVIFYKKEGFPVKELYKKKTI